MPARDANIAELTKPQSSQRDDTTVANDWDQWLRGHLQIELQSLHRALGQCLAEEREKFERKASAFELKLAKLSGAIDVLRGTQPPLPAKFPSVQTWSEDLIYHSGEIVAFAGGCWQAAKDTARVPGTKDWVCLAASGNSLSPRGTYDGNAEYHYLDVVALNGSSFVALKDNPGLCPGDDWQLLASRGSRGQRGVEGARGIMGLRGERGAAAPTIQSWMIDRTRYTATPMMSDGSIGSTLELRALFEQFFSETSKSKG
jgi:hypothetical protein